MDKSIVTLLKMKSFTNDSEQTINSCIHGIYHKIIDNKKHTSKVEISRLGEGVWFSLHQYSVFYSLHIYIEALQYAIHINIISLTYCMKKWATLNYNFLTKAISRIDISQRSL